MGVQAIVGVVGILFLLCCFNITPILMTEISSKSSINTYVLWVRIFRKAHANQGFTALFIYLFILDNARL